MFFANLKILLSKIQICYFFSQSSFSGLIALPGSVSPLRTVSRKIGTGSATLLITYLSFNGIREIASLSSPSQKLLGAQASLRLYVPIPPDC